MTRLLGALGMVVVGAALCVGLWFGYQAWTQHARDAKTHAQTQATSDAIKSEAAAGHDAVQAVQAQAKSEAETKAITQRNTDEITHAPGAEKPVDPLLYAAALRAHCRRLQHIGGNDPPCFVVRHPGS